MEVLAQTLFSGVNKHLLLRRRVGTAGALPHAVGPQTRGNARTTHGNVSGNGDNFTDGQVRGRVSGWAVCAHALSGDGSDGGAVRQQDPQPPCSALFILLRHLGLHGLCMLAQCRFEPETSRTGN